MTNFVKFSEIKNKREQLAKENMSDVKAGAIVCNWNPLNCVYFKNCPYGRRCINIALYGIEPVFEER